MENEAMVVLEEGTEAIAEMACCWATMMYIM